MVIAVPPVMNIYATGYITGSTNAAALSNYDQLLEIQAEDALLSIGTSSSSGSGSATLASFELSDLLDLSPAALTLLNGIETTPSDLAVTGIAGLNTTLTPVQQQQAAAVVAQFASAPLTQQTFTQIESALTAVGINPEQISIQQLLEAYSYAYAPGFALSSQLATDTLASDLLDA